MIFIWLLDVDMGQAAAVSTLMVAIVLLITWLHFHVDAQLARKIKRIAQQRGVSSEMLINLWLQEKVS